MVAPQCNGSGVLSPGEAHYRAGTDTELARNVGEANAFGPQGTDCLDLGRIGLLERLATQLNAVSLPARREAERDIGRRRRLPAILGPWGLAGAFLTGR